MNDVRPILKSRDRVAVWHDDDFKAMMAPFRSAPKPGETINHRGQQFQVGGWNTASGHVVLTDESGGVVKVPASEFGASRTAAIWYHGTPQKLEPGTRLIPGGGPSAWEGFYGTMRPKDDPWYEADRREHVWLADTPESARSWAQSGRGFPPPPVHVYEVEPRGEPQVWKGNPGEGYVTPSASVVREHVFREAAISELDSTNPTGSLFVGYDPLSRTGPLGPHVTTLDRARGGQPEDMVTVYRGAPGSQKEIVPGDFITTNEQLAHDYAGTGRVLRRSVPAADIAADPEEWEGEEYIYHPRTAALSDEDRASVAEQVMEQSGLAGRNFHIPKATMRDAEAQGLFDQYGQRDPQQLQRQYSAEAENYVNGILADHSHRGGIRVMPQHWDLSEPGSGQAITDGMNYIGLAGNDAYEHTLLHEVAHILTRTPEGPAGHGPEFQQTAHDLYHRYLGPESANAYAGIVWPGKERRHTVREAATEESYRGEHQAPATLEEGAPMHDVTGASEGYPIYPKDFYDNPHQYVFSEGNPWDAVSISRIMRARGNPEQRIRVHRAVPLEHVTKRRDGRYVYHEAPLNTGDWVTPAYGYAKYHGESQFGDKFPWTVVSKTVPAKHLFTEGNDVNEWGYGGEPGTAMEWPNAERERRNRGRRQRAQQKAAEREASWDRDAVADELEERILTAEVQTDCGLGLEL